MTARRFYVAEPPPASLTRLPMVTDCSVLAAMIFGEPSRDEALRLISGRSLHAPYLLDHEIVSIASKKQAQGTRADVIEHAVASYLEQHVTLHRTDVAEQLALTRQYALSAYDAAYLWLAVELKAPLITFDRRLADAARKHLAAR